MHARTMMMVVAAGVLAAACESKPVPSTDSAGTAATAAAPAATPAAPAVPDSAATRTAAGDSALAGAVMRLEVDITGRKVHVFRNGQESGSYPVAVGSEQWPTQKGEWTVKQVIFNPAWIPPDESWAEERKPRDPGDPANPLGRAQLVYDPPRTIHGTNQPSSIGTATSHGSIRMNNDAIVALAKQVMEAAGAGKDDAWVQQALANRREKQVVDLPHPVPIRVY